MINILAIVSHDNYAELCEWWWETNQLACLHLWAVNLYVDFSCRSCLSSWVSVVLLVSGTCLNDSNFFITIVRVLLVISCVDFITIVHVVVLLVISVVVLLVTQTTCIKIPNTRYQCTCRQVNTSSLSIENNHERQRRLVTLLNYYRTHIPDDASTYSFARYVKLIMICWLSGLNWVEAAMYCVLAQRRACNNMTNLL